MNPFDYNDSPSPAMVIHMGEIRESAKALAEVILRASNSRERSLALTNLEQAAMWANKAIAHSVPE